MYFSFLALLRVRQTDLELGAPIASRVVLGPQSGRCKKSKGRDLSERILLPSSSFRSVSVKSAQRPSWVGSVVVVDSAVERDVRFVRLETREYSSKGANIAVMAKRPV